jgi:dipeptidyl aminopeptidase/acylaminoacyl peptidase
MKNDSNPDYKTSKANSPDTVWGLGKVIQEIEEKTEEQLAREQENQPDDVPHSDAKRQKTLTGATQHRPKYWGLGIVLLLIMGAVTVWLLGQQQLGKVSTFFLLDFTLRSKPEVALLESRDDKSLLLETDGKYNRVLVQQADRESWLLVSQDDFTVANPSLSPDGAWVAYLSTQEAPEIIIVPLENAERITYESADLATFGRRRDIDVASICDWTSIAWAADGEHLAFFGCAEDPPMSQVFVANFSPMARGDI